MKNIIIIIFGVIGILALSGTVSAFECPSGWDYQKNITINYSKVTSDQTNFPVLIDIYDSDLHDDAQADGDDIMFVMNSSYNISHEIELWNATYNATHAYLIAWLKIPDLSSTIDMEFGMCYGNDEATNMEDIENVWDSDYVMVQHLKETTGNHNDSTGYGNNGTPNGGVNQSGVGKIDSADEFDGSDDYVDCGNDASLIFGTSDFAIEAWFKSPVSPSQSVGSILGKGDLGSGEWMLRLQSNANPNYALNLYNADGLQITSSSAYNDTQWHHAAIVRNGDNAYMYVDGEQVGSNTGVDNTNLSSTKNLRIGNADGVSIRFFDGTIDEVRISDTARSADWINTSYVNQNDPSAFYSIGAEESASVDCNCSTCDECEEKLNDASCTTVTLDTDITDYSSTCINNPAGFSNKIFNCQGHTIDGNDSGYGIFTKRDNNTIKNCIINDFSNGIYIYVGDNLFVENITVHASSNVGINLAGGQFHTVENCNISDQNRWGIYVSGDTQHTVIGNNTITYNTRNGIVLTGSTVSNITIQYNNISYHYDYDYPGLRIESASTSNVIRFNNFIDNNRSVSVHTSNSNSILNNTINVTTQEKSGDAISIGVEYSNTNIICNNTLYNTGREGVGIFLKYSNFTEVSYNTLYEFWDGISMYSSNENTVKYNYVNNCGDNCIYATRLAVAFPSRYNQIYNNTVLNCGAFGARAKGGICFTEGVQNSTVENNTISDSYYGIHLLNYSTINLLNITNNTFTTNHISNSTSHGIYLQWQYVFNNTFNDNIVCDNPVDISENDTGSNSGDNNTCDATYNWNDTGTAGCTYSCTPGVCYCSSCDDCESKLNNPECPEVFLSNNINEINGTCVNCFNISNKTFNCNWSILNGTNILQDGIFVNESKNLNITKCFISNFQNGIRFKDSDSLSVFVNDSVLCGNWNYDLIGIDKTYYGHNNTATKISNFQDIGCDHNTVTHACSMIGECETNSTLALYIGIMVILIVLGYVFQNNYINLLFIFGLFMMSSYFINLCSFSFLWFICVGFSLYYGAILISNIKTKR